MVKLYRQNLCKFRSVLRPSGRRGAILLRQSFDFYVQNQLGPAIAIPYVHGHGAVEIVLCKIVKLANLG